MKRILVALAFFLAATPAFALCPGTLQVKDNAAITANAKYTDDGSGNCQANVALQDGANVTQGAKADTAYAGSGSASIVAILKGLYNGVVASLPAGTNSIGSVGINAGSNSIGSVGLNAGSNSVGNVGLNAGTNNIGSVNLAAGASGGCTPGHVLSAATNNSTSIKASAGTLCSLTVIQTTTTLMDLRLYDTASAPTCSSSVGVVANIPIQSNATSPGVTVNLGPFGAKFASGIGFCLTGAVADNDNTSAATGAVVNYSFN